MYFYLYLNKILKVSFTKLIIGVSVNVLIMHHSKQIKASILSYVQFINAIEIVSFFSNTKVVCTEI